eukprot:g31436.t1
MSELELMKQVAKLREENARLKLEVHNLKQRIRQQDQVIFNMAQDGGMGLQIVTPAQTHRAFNRMTLQRQAFRTEELRVLSEDVCTWLNTQLSVSLTPPLLMAGLSTGVVLCALPNTHSSVFLTPPLLMAGLSTGVVLCDLLQKVDKEILAKLRSKVHVKADPMSFLARDNLRIFLQGCQQLGLEAHTLFSPSDIITSTPNPRPVLHSLLHLSRVLEKKYGIVPPGLVLLEKSIKAAGKGERRATESDEEERKIQSAVTRFCEAKKLAPPQKLSRMGEYKFGEKTTAFVRVVRNVPLVFYQGQWEEFGTFMIQQLDEQVNGEVTSCEIENAENITPGPENLAPEPPVTGTTDKEKDKPALERQLSTDPALHSLGTLSKKQKTMEAQKEFFFLTSVACKLKHQLREDIVVVPNDELWRDCVKEEVDFFNFAEWISARLTREFLTASIKSHENLANEGGSGIRSHRAAMMMSINVRREQERQRAEAIPGKFVL